MSTRAVRLEWTGEGLKFTGRGTQPPTPSSTIDGDNADAPGPMLQLLLAAASCASIDVVLILQKMRVNLGQVTVDVEGTRREEQPRRYTAIHLRFTLSGDGLDKSKADRAVALSVEKYCSVISSLAKDIHVEHEVILV